jgi:hypothetical protein
MPVDLDEAINEVDDPSGSCSNTPMSTRRSYSTRRQRFDVKGAWFMTAA